MFLDIPIVIQGLTSTTRRTPDGPLKNLQSLALRIFSALDLFDENQKSWAAFVNLSYEVIEALAQSSSQSPVFVQQVDCIERFHSDLFDYVRELQTFVKVERLARGIRIRKKVKELCKGLASLWQTCAATLSIPQPIILDEAELQQIVRGDEEEEQVLIANITALLRQGDDKALDRAGIRLDALPWQIRQATHALLNLASDASVSKPIIDDTIVPLLELLRRRSPVAKSMKKENWRIHPSEIADQSSTPIATGSFGEVYFARYYGTEVAIKQLMTSYNETEIADFRHEVDFWHQLVNPHILPLLAACDAVNRPFVVSPFMKNGNLRTYVSDASNVRPIEDKLRLMYQVSLGMCYLHGKNVVHGDLKPQNILLDSFFQAIISDFGMARTRFTSAAATVGRARQMRGGAVSYMAPEMLDDENPMGTSKRTDVFAFGVTLYEVLNNGKPVWVTTDGRPMGPSAIERKISSASRPLRIDGIPDPVWDLIERCWHQDYNARPKFSDILRSLEPYKEAAGPVPVVISPVPSRSQTGTPRLYPSISNDARPLSTDSGSSFTGFTDSPSIAPSQSITESQLGNLPSIVSPSDPYAARPYAPGNFQHWQVPVGNSAGVSRAPVAPHLHDDIAKAHPDVTRLLLNRARSGDVEACLQVAKIITDNKPSTDPMWGVAAQLFQISADQESVEAYFYLGWLYFAGVGVDQRDADAMSYWNEVYQKSYDPILKPIATLMLGMMHYFGRGGHRDKRKGIALARESKTGNFSLGENCLAPDHLIALVTPMTLKFFRLCQLGSSTDSVCRFLEAVCLVNGFGTARDATKAVGIFQQLADDGQDTSQHWLGRCYGFEWGVPKSTERFFRWCNQAAYQEDPFAQYTVAQCYIDGTGVPRDKKKAVEWFEKAANQGHTGARNKLRLNMIGFL